MSDPWDPVVPFDRAAEGARAELGEVIGRMNAVQADLVALTERVIGDDLWAVGGVRSVEHWLTCFAGLSPSRAADVARIARRSGELPRMRARVDAGELTVDQAAVVARHTPATHDARVAEFAGDATVGQLRRALSRYAFTDRDGGGASEEEPDAAPTAHGQASDDGADGGACEPDDHPADEEPPADESADGQSGQGASERGASFGGADRGVPDPLDPSAAPPRLSLEFRDGRFHLEFSASAQIGALVEQALVEAKDALFRQQHPRVTMGEAMVEVASRSLEFAGDVSPSRQSRYRVYLHLDGESGWLQARDGLPEHVIRRVTCNGQVQPVWHVGGKPVSVGRSERTVPDRTRRLVEDRDRGCRYPGCRSRYHLEVHHVVHWRDGGRTDTENLACLCGFHHDAHHRGEFLIAGDADRPNGADGLEFTTRQGGPIGPQSSAPSHVAARAHAEIGDAPRKRATERPYVGPLGERLSLRWVDFGPGTSPAPQPRSPSPPPSPPAPSDSPEEHGRRDSAEDSAGRRAPPTCLPPDARIYAEADGWVYWTTPDAYELAGEDADLTGPAALAYLREQRTG